YRQKDNKYDGWVTEFVDHLKRELEATFKEEVSVYFDINPHDGLLETHDVNASLKEKLKCLVFIPIISRTYCDSKSFAWEHEFKAFVDQASQDQFGLKVTLPNGNVANRLLPIRIHDLDMADIKLCEMVMGGVLRGVDFIYKSAGVNRPLRSKEDNPQENLNHTFYRDQINKVALAIKDIIEGIEGSAAYDQVKDKILQSDEGRETKKVIGDEHVAEEMIKSGKKIKTDESRSHLSKRLLFFRRSSLFFLPILFILLAILIIFSSGSTLPFSKRDWIIITDFDNQTGNPVFDKSLYTAFTLATNQSSYINVFPRSRMIESLTRMQVKDRSIIDDKTGKEIAIREGIILYVVPGISQVGTRYVITAKIMEAKTDNLLRSEIFYAETLDHILSKLDQLSRKLRRDLGESRYKVARQDKPLSRVTTSSLEALKQYSLGIEHHYLLDFEGAKKYYENALHIDTGFTAAKASLGNLLFQKFDTIEGRRLLSQAVKSADNLTYKEKYGILSFYEVNVNHDTNKGIEYTKILTGMYPDDPAYRNNLGWYYQKAGRFEEALEEYKTAVRMNPALALTYSGISWIYLEKLGKADSGLIWSQKMISDNPKNTWGYFNCGTAYVCLGMFDKALTSFQQAKEINPSFTENLYRLAHTYLLLGEYKEAIAMLEKILETDKNDIPAYYDIGVNFQAVGNLAEAHKYYKLFEQAASREWLKEYPDLAETYITLGTVSARLNDLVSSQKLLRKALSIDSTVYDRYAEILCQQGKIPEAIDQVEKALKKGYRNLFWLKANPDLQPLQNEPRFQELINDFFK
ncbi:MAG: tetratricopeptide repeat protein, partial [Bacteroidia bacterium]|nr:tetratricopeptide repeat protein [Bacteroidia bacterium]